MISNLKIAKKRDKILIRAPKRLDAFTAPFLYEDLEEKIRKRISLTLDLSQTQFIDPVGADTIKEGIIRCKQHHVRLTLKGVKPQIKLTLKQMGILQYSRQIKRNQLNDSSDTNRSNLSASDQKAS